MLARTTDALNYAIASQVVGADPLLKQLITQHLVVLAVAETEEHLETIIIEYFRSTTTPAAEKLAESCLSSLLRSIKTSEIAGFLNRLGGQYKERFQTILITQEQDTTRFNNLIVNRHSVVHEAQCNITLEELQSTVPSIHFVCNALYAALHNI